jgi:serine/threonine protein phosphatase PrpC
MGAIFETCLKKTGAIDENKYTPKNIYFANREGKKKDMKMVGQDVPQIIGFDVDNCQIRYIAVYDGHGEKGRVAADFVAREVDNFLTKNKSNFKKWNTRETITDKFKSFFKDVQKKMSKELENFEQSGSCAICCLTIDKNCYVINIGDSRCVLGGRMGSQLYSIQMSTDHKPNDPEEEERIKKAKGEVSNCRDNNFGPYRVYKQGESMPGLAVSRSLGDVAGHDVGCSEYPEVAMKIIEPSDEFVVLGSDGIWDMMGSAEIVAFIYEKLEEFDRSKLCDQIVDECRKRWGLINKYKDDLMREKQHGGDLSSTKSPTTTVPSPVPVNYSGLHITIDDITAVIHFFK